MQLVCDTCKTDSFKESTGKNEKTTSTSGLAHQCHTEKLARFLVSRWQLTISLYFQLLCFLDIRYANKETGTTDGG